jgi:hypothetical protein
MEYCYLRDDNHSILFGCNLPESTVVLCHSETVIMSVARF